MTGHKLVVDAVQRDLPFVTGDIAEKLMTEEEKAEMKKTESRLKRPHGEESRFVYESQTITPSAVGIVTDYCTALADMAHGGRDANLTAEQVEGYWNSVVIGRVKQGNIIDDAKRGTNTEYEVLTKMVDLYPNWLRDKMTTTNANGETDCYISKSPMGWLYAWVVNKIMPWYDEVYSTASYQDYRSNILVKCKNFDASIMDSILPQIKEFERNYRLDMQGYFAREENKQEKFPHESETQYKERMKARGEGFKLLLEQHVKLLASVQAPAATIGAACLHVAENQDTRSQKRGSSYPFVVATAYVAALVSGMDGNEKLVRIKDMDESKWNDEETVTVASHAVVGADGEMGIAKVANGVYKTHEFGGKRYLIVPVEAKQVDIAREETDLVQFQVKGFQHYGTDINTVSQLISSQTIVVQELTSAKGEFLAVGFQGKQVGAVGKETLYNVTKLTNKDLEVVRVEQNRGILLVTAVVKGDSTQTEIITPQIQTNEPAMSYDDVDYSAIEFDTNIG